MNHQKIYDAIIQKAKFENRIKGKGKYYEKHHIFPKCLNGNNDKENLVLLTAREHYICHKLLTYIYKGSRSIVCAFHRMTYGKTNKCAKTSRDYAYTTELHRNTPVSKETIEKCKKIKKGRKDSEETIQRKRGHIPWNKGIHSRTGEKNPMYGKPSLRKGISLSTETIEKIKINTKLAMQRPEVKQKQKQNMPDRHEENNSFFGKHHTKKTIQILKEKKRKYLITLETIENIKNDSNIISFKEIQLKYPQYNRSLLIRIINGDYDKGYYETKSK